MVLADENGADNGRVDFRAGVGPAAAHEPTVTFEVTLHNPIRAECRRQERLQRSDKARDWAKRLAVECADVQVYEAMCNAYGGQSPTREGI